MKKLYFYGFMVFLLIVAGCAPVHLTKCVKEFKYDDKNRMTSEYSECINQTPEKMFPIHLKHLELYE